MFVFLLLMFWYLYFLLNLRLKKFWKLLMPNNLVKICYNLSFLILICLLTLSLRSYIKICYLSLLFNSKKKFSWIILFKKSFVFIKCIHAYFSFLVDKSGDVCISILHEPGDDKWGYEKASERWLPVHTVETILISVISMLADPNDESPANVDAAKDWRDNYPEFKRKVARCVRKSQEDI